MSYPTNDADVTGPRVDAAPRQSNVLRHGESWRSDELLSQPPKTYLGLGGSFCCALVLRIVVLILAVVALVLCIVTQVTKFFEEVEYSNKYDKITDYYLWWRMKITGDRKRKDSKEDDLNGASVCLIIGLILSVISLAMAITYLVLLCVHRSARARDDVEARRRHRSRYQKLEEMDAEMRDMNGNAAPRSSDRRAAAEDGLRREAHGDQVWLYGRERKRRHADRGVWFTLLFALLATFILLLIGFIVAVVVFNDEYKRDEDDRDDETSRMCEGVWIALVSALFALVGFVLCVLRPCIRGRQETLRAPSPFRALAHARGSPSGESERRQFDPYTGGSGVYSPREQVAMSQRVATGVPMQPVQGATYVPAFDEPNLPIADNYATYYPEYGRGFYVNNPTDQAANNRAPPQGKDACEL